MSASISLYFRAGRIRSIKPEFFKHEGLFDLEKETGLPIRVAYAGLWTQCDREGRFVWRPRALKSEIVPYDECDFSRVLDALASRGLCVRYEVEGEVYGWIPKWNRHQSPNNREQDSIIPAPENSAIQKGQQQPVLPGFSTASLTGEARDSDACSTELRVRRKEGKGKERNNNTTLSSSVVSAEQPKSVPFRLLQVNGKFFPISEAQVREWGTLYPAVDVAQELRKMFGWIGANPKKRKSQTGMMRFCTNWLAQEQTKNSEANVKEKSKRPHNPGTGMKEPTDFECWRCRRKVPIGEGQGDDGLFCTQECSDKHAAEIAEHHANKKKK